MKAIKGYAATIIKSAAKNTGQLAVKISKCCRSMWNELLLVIMSIMTINSLFCYPKLTVLIVRLNYFSVS